MADQDKSIEDSTTRDGRRQKRDHDLAALRNRLATIVKVVFGFFAVVLALGALLVVFGESVSPENPVVRFIWDFADKIDGPFGRTDGVFDFTGKNGPKLDALVNWGIAAVLYLIIGNLLRRWLTKSK